MTKQNKSKEAAFSLNRFNELFRYDPKSGQITRLRTIGGQKADSVVSSDDGNGYLRFSMDRKRYSVHRVSYFLTHGYWPKGEIDHIDHNRTNNVCSNLRDVSMSENMRNCSLSKLNTSSVCGVSLNKATKKWHAYISSGAKRIHLGFFDNFQDAINARKLSAEEFGYHSNHGIPKRSPACQ